jgi:hypothetical protein
MADEVYIDVEIDQNGIIHATPRGTKGEECLRLLSVIENINGATTLETKTNADFQEKEVQVSGQQHVGR